SRLIPPPPTSPLFPYTTLFRSCMDFYDILDQVLALLQRHQRVTYRAVQRQFGVDEDTLADLKDALLYAHPEVRVEQGVLEIGERSEEHTSELQSLTNLVCRLLL